MYVEEANGNRKLEEHSKVVDKIQSSHNTLESLVMLKVVEVLKKKEMSRGQTIVDEEVGTSVIVCPSTLCHVGAHLKPFVEFDGTHTKCQYPSSLLSTCLDANNIGILLAYAMVPIENLVEWHQFMALLREAIPQIGGSKFVFIFYWEKGLLLLFSMSSLLPLLLAHGR